MTMINTLTKYGAKMRPLVRWHSVDGCTLGGMT